MIALPYLLQVLVLSGRDKMDKSASNLTDNIRFIYVLIDNLGLSLILSAIRDIQIPAKPFKNELKDYIQIVYPLNQ